MNADTWGKQPVKVSRLALHHVAESAVAGRTYLVGKEISTDCQSVTGGFTREKMARILDWRQEAPERKRKLA